MGNAHSARKDPDELPIRVVGVFGVRYDLEHQEYSDEEFVEQQLQAMVETTQPGPIKFVTGGSRGVELIVERWCERNGISHERIRPIKTVIDAFGHRNDQIIQSSTDVLVFWDGSCPDCSRAIRAAINKQRMVFILPVS